MNLNFKGFYVSSCGRIITSSGKITFGEDDNGYKVVRVKINNKIFRKQVHCLIMEDFCGSSDLIVNHKDGNKSNNNLSNLEYVTYSQNAIHAYNTGLRKATNKPVVQYTLDDKPIMIYKSIKLAE